MKFNVDKCKSMHLGHGNNKSEYRLDNKVLDSTHSEKDLGILDYWWREARISNHWSMQESQQNAGT